MKIKVGQREIGDDCPPFIIAEVGSNWRTLDECLLSIRQAKLCGADAVKFQAFTNKALYGMNYYTFYNCEPGVPLTEKVIEERLEKGDKHIKHEHKSSLPLDWLPLLKAESDRVGIEFMCSAFSPELIDAVDPFVNIHKVASAECTHIRMLEKLRAIGKPVILSTGAKGLSDIMMALEVLGPTPVVLMYCVAAYPARQITLENIPWLKKTFKTLAGYSDHSTDVCAIPQFAVRNYGACVLEKHVSFIDAETPDSGHSLSADQFGMMVKYVCGVEQICHGYGSGIEENPMITRHNRRILAIRDIAIGDTYQEGVNFGIYRSLKDDAKALHPFAVNSVNGKVAKNAINAGDGIGPGDV